ncbi:MAG: hypothetical protein WC356_00185 [Candidatus Micrarchaeia archaeon]|jgi:hypothetical protein
MFKDQERIKKIKSSIKERIEDQRRAFKDFKSYAPNIPNSSQEKIRKKWDNLKPIISNLEELLKKEPTFDNILKLFEGVNDLEENPLGFGKVPGNELLNEILLSEEYIGYINTILKKINMIDISSIEISKKDLIDVLERTKNIPENHELWGTARLNKNKLEISSCGLNTKPLSADARFSTLIFSNSLFYWHTHPKGTNTNFSWDDKMSSEINRIPLILITEENEEYIAKIYVPFSLYTQTPHSKFKELKGFTYSLIIC